MTEKNNDTEKRPENIFVKMIRDLLLGCVALAPLSLFIFLFYNLFYFCNVFIGAIFGVTNSRYTTAFICIFLAVVLIYIGAKLRRRERSLLNIVEYYVIRRIPIIGGLYTAITDIITTFTSHGGESSYLGTVKIPVVGGYMIGFVTRRDVAEDGTPNVAVFVPTSPNPTTGLVFFFPEEVVEYLDMTPENAFKVIISLGIKS